MTGLELAFEEDMRFICREAIKIGYRPRLFAEMLSIKGGLLTAKTVNHARYANRRLYNSL